MGMVHGHEKLKTVPQLNIHEYEMGSGDKVALSLEPHHTHHIMVEAEQWGQEIPMRCCPNRSNRRPDRWPPLPTQLTLSVGLRQQPD